MRVIKYILVVPFQKHYHIQDFFFLNILQVDDFDI